MITVDYNRGRGVQKNLKNDYVIFEQPLMALRSLGSLSHHQTSVLCLMSLELYFLVSYLGRMDANFNFVHIIVYSSVALGTHGQKFIVA